MAKLKELIHIFEASELYEIEVEESGRRVRLRKPPPETVLPRELPAPPAQLAQHSAFVHETVEAHGGPAPSRAGKTTAGAPSSPEPVPEPEEEDGLTTIDSVMVGVFYSAPAPGDPPFVSAGDVIDEDHTLCIIEAMKLMNEVTAKFPAEIVRVLVESGEPVEFGQPLFEVRPLTGM